MTGQDSTRSPEDATPETLLTTAPVTDGALDPVVLRREEKEAAGSCTGAPKTLPLVIARSSRSSTPERCRRSTLSPVQRTVARDWSACLWDSACGLATSSTVDCEDRIVGRGQVSIVLAPDVLPRVPL